MKGIETVEWVDDALGTRLLPFVLSMIAGSVDVIGFLGLGGLFITHVTGNLAILAAKLVVGNQASVSHLISVPVFIVALAGTKLVASRLDRLQVGTLRPLLLLQFLLLFAFLAFGIAAGPRIASNAAIMIFAAMLGVSAMAVQNALVQISLTGAPSTAAMTTNISRFAMDLGDVLLGRSAGDRAKTSERARCAGLAITGFVVGCGLGAWWEAHAGLWSLTLPTGLSLVALAVASSTKRGVAQAECKHNHSQQLLSPPFPGPRIG
jgi:uncharacterized membrane protein YoaK (UPF0700 family)